MYCIESTRANGGGSKRNICPMPLKKAPSNSTLNSSKYKKKSEAQLKIFLKLCCFPSPPGSTAVHASPSTSSHDTGASHGLFENTPPPQGSLRSPLSDPMPSYIQGCHPMHPRQVVEGRSTSTMVMLAREAPITPHAGAFSPGVPGPFAPRAGTHNFSTRLASNKRFSRLDAPSQCATSWRGLEARCTIC